MEVVETKSRSKRMVGTGLRIGKHFVPGGKYILQTLQECLDAPASAMQFFPGNPKRYWPSEPEPEHIDSFKGHTADMWKVVHSPYITNIAEVPDARAAKYTRNSLKRQLLWAEKLGCDAVVFHPGSAKDNPRDDALQWAFEALIEIMGEYEGPVNLLLENDSGTKSGRKIASDIFELKMLVEKVKDERLGICIDTTHAYSQGYTVSAMIEEMRKLGDLLRCVHFNTPDLEVEQGSHLDRHSSCFSDGKFSMDELKAIFLAFRDKPLILEGTPDLAADAVWMLGWEMQYREHGDAITPMLGHELGDIFSLSEDTHIDADLLP